MTRGGIMTRRSEEDELDDDGGITGWEVGDADKQLIENGGVTLDDAALSRFGRTAMVVGLVLLVVYMVYQYTGGAGL
jgi:uncharacterized protein YjeT (DUF2065 family)